MQRVDVPQMQHVDEPWVPLQVQRLTQNQASKAEKAQPKMMVLATGALPHQTHWIRREKG
jgi:hypothetical protein